MIESIMSAITMPDGIFKRLISLRRSIHMHPETAFEEFRTGGAIAEYLNNLGIKCRRGVAKTGLVARINFSGPRSPTIALRADMDAMPITEKTGLQFASKVKGKMHACGHDGHIAIVLGALEMLMQNPPDANVVLLFQPAEEDGGGAKLMINDGALKGVDMIFGGHIDCRLKAGEIGIRRGLETSYTDAIKIRVLGKGGHSARPHEAVDAILVSSMIIMELQNIASRVVDPLNPTVLSIGKIQAGSAHNAIAEEALLEGIIRNTDAQTRKIVIDRLHKTAKALSQLHSARISIDVIEGYPPIINDDKCFDMARSATEEIIGADKIKLLDKPSLGGEDFSFYLQKIPGCFIRFGGADAKSNKSPAPAHSPKFDFSENAIKTGALILSGMVRKAAKPR